VSRSSFSQRPGTKPPRVEPFASAESNSGGYTTLPNTLLRVWIPVWSENRKCQKTNAACWVSVGSTDGSFNNVKRLV
jgi:hypothetical protein